MTGNLKKPCPSAPKITDNLKNILGAGGRHEPNIFLITALSKLLHQIQDF